MIIKRLSHTFTTIAATTNFTTFEFSPTGVPISTAPAVNDRGEVAFWGMDSSRDAGIFVGDGDLLKTIADTSGDFSFLGVGSSINEHETVAFLAGLDSGDAGYFTSNGVTTLITDSLGQFNLQRIPTLDNLFGEPVISDRGKIAFRADLNSGEKGIFSNTKDRIRTIADSGSELTTFGITPDIDTKGTVVFSAGTAPVPGAFWAKLADGRSGVFRADVDNHPKPTSGLDPLYSQIERYTTTIAAAGDSADVYFPSLPNSVCSSTEFPVALMLQGALVDKSDYSNFASQVASYGFVVVVPNHERTLPAPNGQPMTGLLSEQSQVNDVLAQMKAEDRDASSPIFRIVDADNLGLLGHSFGGAVGLAASQEEIQVPGIYSPGYTQPPELKAGIFYGANLRNQQTNEALPINNDDVALGLIQGELDGVAAPINAQRTYDQILNPPKALITVKGANHYSITNQDNPAREPNRPTLDQTIATETIAQWSGLFLRANLLGDRTALDAVFNASPAFDPNINIISQP